MYLENWISLIYKDIESKSSLLYTMVFGILHHYGVNKLKGSFSTYVSDTKNKQHGDYGIRVQYKQLTYF